MCIRDSCAAYLFLFYADLADRAGAPTRFDLVVGVCGMVLLLEATRRALGPPLMVVALVFITYTFAGPYMPEVIEHKGASLAKGMSHYYRTTEGVFGIALGVSTSMVFHFVLFGCEYDSGIPRQVLAIDHQRIERGLETGVADLSDVL